MPTKAPRTCQHSGILRLNQEVPQDQTHLQFKPWFLHFGRTGLGAKWIARIKMALFHRAPNPTAQPGQPTMYSSCSGYRNYTRVRVVTNRPTASPALPYSRSEDLEDLASKAHRQKCGKVSKTAATGLRWTKSMGRMPDHGV